jgi:serine protease
LGAGTATTGADGAVTFTPTPAASTTYRASFPGSDTYGTASSSQVTVSVRPTVTARPQASTVTTTQTITVTGSVAPNHHGQTVYLQRLASGAWKGVATATLTSASTYTLKAKPPGRGTFSYRVVKRADADHTSGTSRSFTVTVR